MVNALFGLGIRADDGTAFKGVEHFGGVKAEYPQIPVVKHAAVMALYAEGVGSVVDNFEIVGTSNLLDTIHIAGVSIAVHRHNSSGAWGDGGFDLVRVEVERNRVDVYKHRLDAVP